MEAWDTLAAVEEGLTTLQRSPDATVAIEQLAVVTHRLRGAAALNGFPQLAALAAAMEEAVERVAATSGSMEPHSLTTLNDMLFGLKTSLDHIGETGAEDEGIAHLLAALAPPTPRAPVDETARRLDELDRFFTEQHDVLEYFLPEAVEHLESMAQSLVTLEGEGSSESELAALFRAVHTLKGAAYTVGCAMIGDLAHRVEDMLGEVREQKRPLDRAAIETVFAGLDALRLLVRSAEERVDTRAAAYDRATAMLDALPAIGALTVESSPSIEPELEQAAGATVMTSARAPGQVSIEETPAAPPDETARRLDELDRFFTEQHDVLEYFLPEAVEHLESMAQSLVALESEGSSESELAALFRAVHTLKGAAYTVGCGVIGDFAHRVEDMLGEVREQKRPLDRAAIEIVFASLDALRLLVRSVEDRSDTRVAVFERATALLDALPAIGALTVESSPSIEPELEQAAGATVMTSARAPGQVSIEETPAAPPDETARRLDELDRFFTEQHDVLEYFLPEAVEHLESMAQSLVALESEGSSESELAALFRAVHTLKGAAYTVGCGVIGDFAHRVEDMLGEVREQKRPLDRAAIEIVFASLDALRLLVRSVEDRSDTRVAVFERATAL